MTQALLRLDSAALKALRTRFHQGAFERTALAYTSIGEFGGVWIAAALVGAALDRERRGSWLATAVLVPASLTANFLVKASFRRQRPTLEGLAPIGRKPASLSFPSGHAATSFAAATAIGALVPPARRHLLVAAALMALTRPYLGVHYPSDAVAGALVGTAVGKAATAVIVRDR